MQCYTETSSRGARIAWRFNAFRQGVKLGQLAPDENVFGRRL